MSAVEEPVIGPSGPAEEGPPAAPRRVLRVALPAGVLALHVALVLFFCPPAAVFSQYPVFTIDHILHYGQAAKVQKAHQGWGKTWAYDPFHLAGTVEGAGLDSDNKGAEAWVIALSWLKVPPARAFNFFLLFIQLALPFAGYGAARLLAFGHRGGTLAALLFVLLWFFDFFLHWCWYCGMYSYATASYLCGLCLALFYRFTGGAAGGTARSPGRGASLGWYVGLLVAMCVTHVVHPYAFFVLVVPLVALYARSFRRLGLLRHVAIAGVVAATVAANLWWLIPTLKLRHHLVVEGSGRYLQTTLSYLITDYLDVLQDAYESGAFGVRTAFRVVVIVAAVAGLWAWRKARDDRFLPFALTLAWLFAFAYLGGYSRWTCYLQPYRHIAPFTLLCAFPAAVFLLEAFRRDQLRALWRAGAGALIVLLALAVPRLGITVLSWFHNHVVFKTRPAPGENVGALRPQPLTGLKQGEPPRYRLQEFPEVWPLILAKVRQECRGRVLVREWMLAEYLSASEVPVLGGFPDRVVQQSVANLFVRHPDGGMPHEDLGPYLERYAVGCLLLSAPTPKLELRTDLFEPVIIAGERRLYRTRREPSYLETGQGRVRQALNQIAVDDAAGDDVVLRFHWMETLRCSPGCEVERASVPGDPVGFIRVRKPPRAFVVHNSYRWPATPRRKP
ncbi:MAG: hypothetical protein HY906_17585 [Deltaproteobacteria bacterium]|nr:hypothetical protein [Deltaproteobacteria bacterium]